MPYTSNIVPNSIVPPIKFSNQVDSSVVLWVISFGRKPPLPIFKSASEDCNVFAYDYFHDFVIYYAFAYIIILI